jgi:glucosamine kinase
MSGAAFPGVLAIDGGGSFTRAWVVERNGVVRARGSAGPANPHSVGWDGAAAALRQAVAGTGLRATFAAVHVGLAGVGSDDARRRLRALIAEEGLAAPDGIGVGHDLDTALAGGLAGEPGVVLVAGTGSAAYGVNREGRAVQAGGWGPWLDDGGSAWWLVLEAMRAVVRSLDGRGPATGLESELRGALGARDWREVLNRLHGGGLDRAAVAALAPRVLSLAEAGDAVAGALCDCGAAELAALAGTVMRRLFPDGVARIVTVGGLAENGNYGHRLRAAIEREVPRAEVVAPVLPPVGGAALRALQRAGVTVDASVLAQLRRAATDSGR